MSRTNVWVTLAALLLVVALAPAARADIFELNVDFCSTGCIPAGMTSVGTVEVTSPLANTVQVAVNITPPLEFHGGRGLDSFVFSVIGFPNLTVGNGFTILDAGGSVWTQNATVKADGAGDFMYSFDCTQGPNGCTPAPVRTFVFRITAPGLTLAAVESVNNKNVVFAADVSNSTISGFTGMVGATGVPSVPEPTSIVFLGTGLLAVGIVLRKKVKA